ncbi:hypothetical protein BKA70DRAFT_1113066, partial [Coprinopsis sp. MPI-PUGE-AT-0042]
QMGLITMDNASNNGTLMEEFAEMMSSLSGEDFDADGNRIRLVEIFNSDLVGRVRKIVSACRSSGQRRKFLQVIITAGNEQQAWGVDEKGEPVVLPNVQLLRDCETRWSSTYLMLCRFLTLEKAIREFCNQNPDLRDLSFKKDEIQVLGDLISVLAIPHGAQELLSSERTPTLSMALPTYKLILDGWKLQARLLPHMRPFINAGIKKLEEKYIPLTRKTRAYAIAMTVNPAIKLSWAQQTGGENESLLEPVEDALRGSRSGLR